MRTLAIAVFLVTGAVNLQLPLYATYAREARLGAGALSALLAGYVAALLVALVLLAGVSDRVGRRPVVLVALLCAVVATGVVMVAPGAGGLAVARWFQGFGVALCMSAATAWMAEAAGPDRAARVATWASTAGFGFGALVTTAWLWLDPVGTPGSYGLWAAALAVAAVVVWRLPTVALPDPGAPLLRLPDFPPGSRLPAAAVCLGWAVSGVVVAVLPSVLADLGVGAAAGPALFAMLTGGFVAQLHAHRLDSRTNLLAGSVVLSVGVAVLTVGVVSGSAVWVLAGTAVAGASTHGYGYLGGLAAVTGLGCSAARTVAGYFLAAYVGFGVPAVAVGWAVEVWGASTTFAVAAAVVFAGSIAVGGATVRR